MQKNITKLLILTIILTAALSVNYLFAAWIGPTQAPTGGNTSTPEHVGTTDQVKNGGLSLCALSVFGNGYFQGNVGIGAVSPQAKLHIGGTPTVDGLMFPDGTLQTTASVDAAASSGPTVQSGKINVGASESVRTVTFPTRYSSAPIVVASSGSSTGGRSSGSHLHHVEVYSITTTGFKVWREGHDGSRRGFINWIAVGN